MTDSNGNVTSTIELDPFGGDTNRTVNGATQPHTFTSYERDTTGGMDEAMMRRYHGWWSRFDQPDPYDGSYDSTDPQSFNRYSYVGNDPVNYVDPNGLKKCWDVQRKEWFECGDPNDVVRIYTVDFSISWGAWNSMSQLFARYRAISEFQALWPIKEIPEPRALPTPQPQNPTPAPLPQKSGESVPDNLASCEVYKASNRPDLYTVCRFAGTKPYANCIRDCLQKQYSANRIVGFYRDPLLLIGSPLAGPIIALPAAQFGPSVHTFCYTICAVR